jgi:hypothetical protein
MKVLV